MISVALKMPQSLVSKLNVIAEKHQTSRSELIRTAVLKYIDADQSKAAEPSAYDCVREFSGTVEGPGALSSHARHMEGYGR